MWQSENGLFIDADSVFLFATKSGRNPNRTSLPRQLCERNRTGKPLFAESNSYFRSESPATHRPLGSRPASPDGQRFRFLLPRKSDALPPHVIWRSEGLFIRIRGFVFCPITRTRTQVGGGGRQQTETNEHNTDLSNERSATAANGFVFCPENPTVHIGVQCRRRPMGRVFIHVVQEVRRPTVVRNMAIGKTVCPPSRIRFSFDPKVGPNDIPAEFAPTANANE